MNKIKLLSPQVANQIAAGEVIERPASIIKELMENSIDAGADDITVIITRSGTSLIKITDNGCGIAKDDLPLAISQHATSKIVSIADLERVSSLGFRGEALASICSAARIKITSRVDTQGEQAAWSLESHGDPSEYTITPASHPSGTTIEVRDLFYNIPVRRRFLKSLKTEYYHITEVFQKIALANFSCSFTLVSDDKVVYKLPKASNKFARDNRVKKIFGYGFIKEAIYFEGEAPSIKIHGWISNIDYTRSQTDQQYFFLNNRAIRDKLILHAIKYVYESLIPSGRHPCYILYLTIDPSTVDVNVHPTKHEVRFAESRWVHQFVVQQLSNVLLSDGVDEPETFHDSFRTSFSDLGEEPFRKDLGSARIALDRDDTSALSYDSSSHTLSPPSSAVTSYFNAVIPAEEPGSSRQVYSSRLFEVDRDKQDDTCTDKAAYNKMIQNLGKIVANIGNNLVLTNYQNNYYLVDIKQSYKFLAYSKLLAEWSASQSLTSYELLLKPVVLFCDLPSAVISAGELRSSKERADSSGSGLKLDNKLKQIILKLLEKSKQYGFEVELSYSSASSDSNSDNSSIQEFFIANESGEIWNSIIIHKVPEACRFADASELFMTLISNLVQNNLELEDVEDRAILFNNLASRAISRLEGNILLSEKQIIIDKLAKKEYNSSLGYVSKFCKKLEEQDFCNMLID